MKKVLISITAALVVLTALYLFVEGKLLPFNTVGEAVEAGYAQTAGFIALRLKRRIEIEDKKLDYLLQGIGSKAPLSEDIPALDNYIESSPYCEKIIVIDGDQKILYFAPRGETASRTERQNERLFDRIPEALNGVVSDPIGHSLIFSKVIAGSRILFYYSSDLLRMLFEDIETLEYSNFVILKHDFIIVNFPEIDPQDEANADRLFAMISEEDTGSVRVEVEDSDVTVYYSKIASPYENLTVGLGVRTEEVGISAIGLVILLSQTVVVLALLIFVFVSIGQKKGRITGVQESIPAGEEMSEGIAETQPVEVVASEAGQLEEISSERAGILSLSDIEEVSEIEEIGEAEVADETEEADLEYLPEQDVGGKEEKKRKAAPPNETENSQETGFSGETGDLADLETVQRGLDKGTNSSGDGKASLEAEEHIEDDLSKLESEQGLPELEKLVKGKIDSDFEEAYRRKVSRYKDDELSQLIDEMEGADESEARGRLDTVFKRWLRNLNLSKGALLLQEKEGDFRVSVSVGLSDESRKQLRFKVDESLHRTILSKGKLLYIKQDAFQHDGLRDKFDIRDAAKIKSLFFAPVGRSTVGTPPGKQGAAPVTGIIVVALTTGETISPEIISKEIKRIKKIIIKYL